MKLKEIWEPSEQEPCVNLPRWGLKQACLCFSYDALQRVNLPRWGLKRAGKVEKFKNVGEGVNLPRWGLKLHRFADSVVKRFGV